MRGVVLVFYAQKGPGLTDSTDPRGEVSRSSESMSQTSRSDSSSPSMFSRAKRTMAEYCRDSSLGVGVTFRRRCKILQPHVSLAQRFGVEISYTRHA